ncbi:MAG: J domain-containing protein [Pirellulales bacterium]
MAKDHYKTLGVSRTATKEEIQKAYRTLARKHHPDLNPTDKEAKKKFQDIQAAFDVLNDPQKREKYDRFGPEFESMGQGGPQGGGPYSWTPRGGGPQEFDFSDVFGERNAGEGAGGFGDFFRQFRRAGGGAGPQTHIAPKGADIEHELPVPFASAVSGGEAQVSVRRQSGKVETINVKIPAGIEDGQKIRLRGQGEPGTAGRPAGDILITVRVSEHPYYTRRGNRLEVVLPVTLAEAALGAKIDLSTPRGTIRLTVPPGTSSGKKLRVKGQGVAAAGRPPGDLVAEVQIVLPSHLDEEDRAAIEKIGSKHPQDPRANLRW